jgi:hypothetical protein
LIDGGDDFSGQGAVIHMCRVGFTFLISRFLFVLILGALGVLAAN